MRLIHDIWARISRDKRSNLYITLEGYISTLTSLKRLLLRGIQDSMFARISISRVVDRDFNY